MCRRVVDAGRYLRSACNIPVKYPLPKLVVVSKTGTVLDDVHDLMPFILEEVNVKEVATTSDESKYNVTLKGVWV